MRFSTSATERMRIDSAGNLLVGKTSSSFSTAGVELASGGTAGKVQITRDGGSPLALSRKTSDGAIALFYKDTTQVGSIGAYNSATAILSGSAGSYSGLYLNTNRIEPVGNNFGSEIRANNTIDIGSSTYKFKDLYLSGASYIHDVRSTGTQYFTHTTDVRFRTVFGSERLRIDSSGRVGIGTSSPLAPLHIEGTGNEILRINSNKNKND